MIKKFFITISIISVLILSMIPSVFAQDQEITLAWDANVEPDLKLYTIYYGTASGDYSHVINTETDTSGRPPACTTYDPFDANCCEYTVKGLSIGTYYFAATASDQDGNQSEFSIELTHTFIDDSTTEKLPKQLEQPSKIQSIPPIE